MGIRGFFCLAAVTAFTAIGCGPSGQSLVFSSQPTDGTAGASFSPVVQVSVVDASGRPVLGSERVINLTLSGGSGGTLSGTTKLVTHNGVATFTDLSIAKAGSGYALTASVEKMGSATSNTFAINPAAASRLVIATQPSDSSADGPIGPAVQVAVQDGFGNPITSSTATVTAALGANPTKATLSGTTTAKVANGVATFPGLSLTKAGSGYTLAFSTTGVFTATSSPFKINPGNLAKLAFTTPPANAVAGAALAPKVVVTAQDANGNTITGFTAPVTVALGGSAGGASLSGTTTANAVAGVASFTGLSVQRVGSFTLAATSGALTGSSPSFTISPAAPAALAFAAGPTDTVAGAAIAPAVTVAVVDAYGNTVTSATNSVTLGLSLNPGGATLGGTLTRSAVAGVATFNDLSIQKAWTGYALGASASGLTSATSSAFNINPAAASALAFTTQPSNTVAGATVSPAVVATVQDTYGNTITSSSANITLALAANPGGGTLLGTLTQSAVNGQATFGDLSIQKAATGYQLSATGASLPAATSSTFNVTPAAASQLAFSVQPSNTNINVPISPAVQVSILDSYGNLNTSAASVTVSLASGPSGATLGGTLTRGAVSGVATFGDLTVDTSGTGYTLQAASGSLPNATSSAFSAFQPTLVYTNPAASGKLALVQNASSTPVKIVLDVVTTQSLTGYSVGMNLPVDATKVTPDASLITPGTALSPGSTTAGVPAFAAALPTSGPLASVLTSGLSQKAGGAGAVTTDTTVSPGSVLYTLALDVNPASGAGTVFDGSTIASNPKFRALLRDKLGNDVATSTDFAIGKLVVQLQ